MNSRRLNLILYLGAAGFLTFAIWILLGVKRHLEDETFRSIRNTQAFFPRSLLHGVDSPLMDITRLRQAAQAAESTHFVKRLFVVRIIEDDGRTREFIVYPYSQSPGDTDSAPGPLGPTFQKFPLEDGQGRYGALYLEWDASSLAGLRRAIWTLVALLALILATLTLRLWRQQISLIRVAGELEENRQQMIRLERLALAGQLTANILHDLKKPVLNMRYELDDLRLTLGGAARADKGLRAIEEQISLYFAVLRDLSLERFVRADDAEKEYVDLPGIIDQACRLVQYEREKTRVAIEAEPGLPPVFAQPHRLIQVFSNLALNAYQAMKGDGDLRFDIRRDGGFLRIEAADTGPGIDPASLPSIFQPFYSTKPAAAGTGLGLYIARQILRDLGGDIVALERTEGLGARFQVTIPVTGPECVDSLETSPQSPG